MYKPGSTYRIQFHKNFNFTDFQKIIPFLHSLGIKTIYASPIFQSVKGSTHGYDGINPNVINPEIGTLNQFRAIAAQLKKHGMGWLQDFVPNHMAFSPENTWLCDFLEKGKMSEYDIFFDKSQNDILMAPFLGTTLNEALEQHLLEFVYKNGRIQLKYYDMEYPLNYTGYFDIVNHEMYDSIKFEPIRNKIELLFQVMDKKEFDVLWEEALALLKEVLEDKTRRKTFENGLKKISRNKSLFREIIDVQFYRYCFWKDTNHVINYRRFFTINGLICLNMQQEDVFKEYHKLLYQLISEDLIQGIRIDHIDGLYEPKRYLEQLRLLAGEDVYIIVEKILQTYELLPETWPVQGTTGYDFAAQVNNVLLHPEKENHAPVFHNVKATKGKTVKEYMEYYKKQILYEYMGGEWENLFREFVKCVETIPASITDASLKNVIGEMLVCCPVYRYYNEAMPFNKADKKLFDDLIESVAKRGNVDADALHFFKECFHDKALPENDAYYECLSHFWKRCMQVTGPLMAKGVEDTFMYNYPESLSQNEVGNSPAAARGDINAFHEKMQYKQKHFPLSLNATATHDTKRGEDSRARLQLISYDTEWMKLAAKWMAEPPGRFEDLTDEERYFIVQSIYAAMDASDETGFDDRLKAFLIKAARESKFHSNWDEPDEKYETRLFEFALAVKNGIGGNDLSLQQYITNLKIPIVINALVQLTLKVMCPGTPDFFQGTELWDLSFVDPDNRRAIDFGKRIEIMDDINRADFRLETLLASGNDGAIKLYTTSKLLQLRKEMPETFDHGLYEPLQVSPDYISFIRRYAEDWVIVIVPLGGRSKPVKDSFQIQEDAPQYWNNIFTNAVVERDKLDVLEELKLFPILVLKSEKSLNKRKAGILMPLFSLPSSFGIGGMGKEAYDFINALSRSRQRFWQILPLNPTLKKNAYSPYASSSSYAGDPVYIDPVLLAEDGLLTHKDLKGLTDYVDHKVEYEMVKRDKERLLLKAWRSFQKDTNANLTKDFSLFCEEENYWLDIYALYIVIKQEQKGFAWYKWPKALKDGEPRAIAQLKQNGKDAIGFQKWMQFLFFRQWKALKLFARQMNVSIIGDIPFYMSHDSADVWAHKAYFNLDSNGNMLYEAGVPPDYFSATGQAWGMPTYNWKVQEKNAFDWWLKRLGHHVGMFDLVRLDHFRAFFDYWEITGNAPDAIHGNWHDGPQDKLFKEIKERFPAMPFIAEDLGEMHPGVFAFRDKYGLPGMRVLQFGFESYKATSNDVPHNFTTHTVVYTGTHDNNTLQGWYKQLPPASKEDLKLYTGKKLNKEKVANAMVDMAYSSIAELVIIPLQDILNLDETNRINTPSTTKGNWTWWLPAKELNEAVLQRLRTLAIRYNR